MVTIPNATMVALVSQLDQRFADLGARLDQMRAEAAVDHARVRDDIQAVADRVNLIESREDVRKGREEQTERVVANLTARGSLALGAIGVAIALADRIAGHLL